MNLFASGRRRGEIICNRKILEFTASLHYKRLTAKGNLFTIRVGISHRALATSAAESITWVWIGTHAEYDRLIKGD